MASWACADTTIHGLMFIIQWISGQLGMCSHNNPRAMLIVQWISGQLGMCSHNNPWAHVYYTMNQWPTGNVQRQQSMGSSLLYNKSVAKWACADTTIHGLMFIVQWVSGQLGMCRHNNPWAHVCCTMNQWPTGHVQTKQSMGSCLLYNKSVANWACADKTIHGIMFIVQ